MVIFSVATTGSGKEPRAMTPLWNMLLRSDLPEDLFEDLSFAVFGLGDTAYEKFCWPAKLLSRRLISLGANEICPRGEGDEQHLLGFVPTASSDHSVLKWVFRIDGAFEPWIKQLVDVLLQIYPLPPGISIVPADSLPPPRMAISNVHSTDVGSRDGASARDDDIRMATVLCNRRITAEDWYQDVRHFEFDFNDDIR